MSFFDLFIGSEQSKYAGFAIAAVVFVICLSVLLTSTEVSLVERVTTILFMILIITFPVALALFELTCIVKGNSNNACGYYAWIVTAIIVFHCLVIIVFTFSSMFTYKKALVTVDAESKMNNISQENAQQIAESMMNMQDSMPVKEKKKPAQSAQSAQPAQPAEPAQPAQTAGNSDDLLNFAPETNTSGEISGFSSQEFSQF